jgi:hypothetical protein
MPDSCDFCSAWDYVADFSHFHLAVFPMIAQTTAGVRHHEGRYLRAAENLRFALHAIPPGRPAVLPQLSGMRTAPAGMAGSRRGGDDRAPIRTRLLDHRFANAHRTICDS